MYGESKELVMINLHDEEYTSVTAAREVLEESGGMLIRLENGNRRNIRFRLNGRNYAFDANRIFSRAGISKSLEENGRVTDAAIAEVEKFAARILELIPGKPSCIIALHNNDDGNFSVQSYLPGNSREKDAKDVYVNPALDPDDFFLTTDSEMHKALAEKKFNSVFQDNENANRDGSLSIYFGEKGIRYINCETEHGKASQYLEMLKAAVQVIAE
jgi:hypothetical protein